MQIIAFSSMIVAAFALLVFLLRIAQTISPVFALINIGLVVVAIVWKNREERSSPQRRRRTKVIS
jgi:hypothetical protein